MKKTRASSRLSTEQVLETYFYEPTLIPEDCESILKLPFKPGYQFDEDRLIVIQSNPRVEAWLQLNESSLLLLNANSDPAESSEMSFLSAKIFQRVSTVADELKDSSNRLIPLAFFCGRHRDYLGDVNGKPNELAMSLLLQLLDKGRDLGFSNLGDAFDHLDPQDIASIFSVFRKLLSQLPRSVIVILIIDGMRYFSYPPQRQTGLQEVMDELVSIHRTEYKATLKFFFANSARAEYVEYLFEDDEILRMPRDLAGASRYGLLPWKHPVNFGENLTKVEGVGDDADILA